MNNICAKKLQELEFESLKLHDISNTQCLEVLTLIEIPQDIFHIELLALFVERLVLDFGEVNHHFVFVF